MSQTDQSVRKSLHQWKAEISEVLDGSDQMMSRKARSSMNRLNEEMYSISPALVVLRNGAHGIR